MSNKDDCLGSLLGIVLVAGFMCRWISNESYGISNDKMKGKSCSSQYGISFAFFIANQLIEGF
jgi:hypothetical protein